MTKVARQKQLALKISGNPFLTDDELSEIFKVSTATIRLYRLELNIPEYRERIKNVAEGNINKVKSLQSDEIIGEILSIEPGKYGISILTTLESMVFERTKIVRGHYIYSFAEALAIAVMDARAALVGVANIKYIKPVYVGVKLVAHAEIRSVKNDKFIVWVRIKENRQEVFRGKFILVLCQP